MEKGRLGCRAGQAQQQRRTHHQGKETRPAMAEPQVRQFHLIEQDKKESCAEHQNQRGQQGEQVLGVDLRRFGAQIGLSQRLNNGHQRQTPNQKITQMPQPRLAEGQQQTAEEKGPGPVSTQPGQIISQNSSFVGQEFVGQIPRPEKIQTAGSGIEKSVPSGPPRMAACFPSVRNPPCQKGCD